jgi:hypothetical protein
MFNFDFLQFKKEKDLKIKLTKVSKELLDLEKQRCDPGAGFGDRDALKWYMDSIKIKQEQEARLSRDYDRIVSYRIQLSSAISAVFLAVITCLESCGRFKG